jgi:hypothetical protein
MQLLTKRAPDGAQQAERPVAAPPESVYPACKKLGASLSDYQSVETELEEFRGKAAKAQGDMDMLGESSLSEEDSLKAISEAHGRKALYASRIATVERKSAGFLAELQTSLVAAIGEVTHQVRKELDRRTGILTQRVIEALGGIDEHAIVRGELAMITRNSKLVRAVERLIPHPLFSVDSMPAANVVAAAQGLLKNLELVTFEIGREI